VSGKLPIATGLAKILAKIMKIELFTINNRERKSESLETVDLDFIPRIDDLYFSKKSDSFYKVIKIHFSTDKINIQVGKINYRPELDELYKSLF
jgi:hypothetical protein